MTRTEIAPLVMTDIQARIAKGVATYGEPLTSHNGRDALWDAYEEALDLALYLRQAIEERKPKQDGLSLSDLLLGPAEELSDWACSPHHTARKCPGCIYCQ